MEIVLQINTTENNKINKTVTTVTTLSGTLRDSVSVINPVIMIEGDASEIAQCNYMTIPDFNRKYFITEIKSIRTGLVEVSGHVDVLSTYADEILSNYAIIRRQENEWNLYLNDGVFKIYQNPNIATKEFPSGFSAMEFVLAVAGS